MRRQSSQPKRIPASRNPLRWLVADERRRMVRTALEQLVQRDREILLLKYSEDWSYKELAEHLGITQVALQARLHRARQRLREQIEAVNKTP